MFGLFKRSDQIALLDEMIAEKFVQLRAMRRAASEVSMPDENGYCRVCGGSDSEAAEHKAKLVDLMAKSCGCLARSLTSERTFRHGKSHSSAYNVWVNMIRRCDDPKNASYLYYGARGIGVCEAWRTFKNFFDDMGDRPADRSIDRIDNSGNYEPGNCRWATITEQLANRRPRGTA